MTSETIATFLTGYLHGLREETRDEKSGSKFGFDHIVLKLAEADGFLPLRLAYHRGGRVNAPKPKKENEFGEDLKVISHDGTKLVIFVLKDEALTYKNWTSENFDKDLRLAVLQDLTPMGLRSVDEVKIILAYNKDDEARGVEAFEKFVSSIGSSIGEGAKLAFERWNLTTLTELVRKKLIESPALLPEKFFRAFSYICWQVEDFSHGSDQWREVLIPDWKEFLDSILSKSASEKEVRLVSVALIILHAHGKKDPSWETGWVEMMEWAVIALWRTARNLNKTAVSKEVMAIWVGFYLAELESFYVRNAEMLATEDSLSCGRGGHFAEALSAHCAYWHLARIGILGGSIMQMVNVAPKDQTRDDLVGIYTRIVEILVGMLNANPSCFRPLLDIHHIQLYLLWLLLASMGRHREALEIFANIHERLVLRRSGKGGVKVIDQSNSWSNLLEAMATGEMPSESFGKSSYLLQMIIEICACKLGVQGEALAWAFYRHLIQGLDDEGQSLKFSDKVELQSWVPPVGWVDKVLVGAVGFEGICVTVDYSLGDEGADSFPAEVRKFAETMDAAHPPESIDRVPFGVVILACILHNSPMPPAFWREALVGQFPTS